MKQNLTEQKSRLIGLIALTVLLVALAVMVVLTVNAKDRGVPTAPGPLNQPSPSASPTVV